MLIFLPFSIFMWYEENCNSISRYFNVACYWRFYH